jgi:hypothetical protein
LFEPLLETVHALFVIQSGQFDSVPSARFKRARYGFANSGTPCYNACFGRL